MTELACPDQIRASVFVAPGSPLELRRFPRPSLAAGEALVQISCATLCGSDVHTYLGKRHGPAPSVLGHEAVGRIVAFGPGEPLHDYLGQPLRLGDRVSWSVAACCQECFFCRHELPQKCERLFKYGHEACDGEHPLSGGLAEFCHLARGTAIIRVPPEIPDPVASSANCATATVAAACRAAGGCHEKNVLIHGAGLLGLTAAAMAVADGAKNIIVTDIDAKRLARATQFGATTTVNVADDASQLMHQIRTLTDGRGVDVAFEMSGTAEAAAAGLMHLRIGGQLILVGAVRPIGVIPLDVETVVRKMWTIQGVHNYAPGDLATAIDFLAENHQRFPFAELVTEEFPLDHADEAFCRMVETGAVRVAVRPYIG